MFRYICFDWDRRNTASCASVARYTQRLRATSDTWRCAHSSLGLEVMVADERRGSSGVYELANHSGVVLGTIFRNGSVSTQHGRSFFGKDESAELVASQGLKLFSSCWGRYVALLATAEQDRVFLIRDPMGALPCLYAKHEGVTIIFSFMEDYVTLGLGRHSINWDYIAAQVVVPVIDAPETAINHVMELQPGECAEFRDGELISRKLFWDPRDIAASSKIEDFAEAGRLLRETVVTCVHAWASCYSTILHRLSGGLDSSIVACCLQDAPSKPQIVCLNFRSDSSNGDEREFARIVAEQTKLPLIEEARNPDFRLSDMLDFVLTARPSICLMGSEAARTEARITRAQGAGARFGGSGGDQLFFRNPAMLAVADYLWNHGIRPKALRLALSAAYLDKSSIWSVLAKALRAHAVDPWTAADVCSYRTLVSEHVMRDFRNMHQHRFSHPCLDGTKRVPPGKQDLIFSWTSPTPLYDYSGRGDDPERVEPLLSQPIVELCLKIPTYVLTHSGWDRLLARNAFIGRVPQKVLSRRWKGGVQEHVKSILLGNIDFVREMLLDGFLVRERLVDKARLEDALSGRPCAVPAELTEIFDHLGTEAWIQRWSTLQSENAHPA